jgi:hypothetical protein
MIYRRPGFLVVVLLGSSPVPLYRQLARLATHRKTEKEIQLADGRGGGAESYDGEKAFSTL